MKEWTEAYREAAQFTAWHFRVGAWFWTAAFVIIAAFLHQAIAWALAPAAWFGLRSLASLFDRVR